MNGRSGMRACLECGREFRTRPSAVGKYCSRACLGIANGKRASAQPKTRITKFCKVCDKKMLVIPSLAERKTCCSRKCNGMQALGAPGRRPRSSKIGDDAILQWAECGRFGTDLDWTPELRVGRWTIDLAFPDLRLAIELDGIYWHGRPGMADHDAKKTADLVSKGWFVHRIPIEQNDTAHWLAQCIDAAVFRQLYRKVAAA